jgi:Fur family zinc uptake transcriptional regulator
LAEALSRTDLARAERTCAEAGGKLTAPRRDVLSLLLEADQPLAAYDLLARMQTLRGQTHPPSRKAYVACRNGSQSHRPVFLVCRVCKAATEVSLQGTDSLLADLAEGVGFECEQIVLEVQGRCRACVEASSPT